MSNKQKLNDNQTIGLIVYLGDGVGHCTWDKCNHCINTNDKYCSNCGRKIVEYKYVR